MVMATEAYKINKSKTGHPVNGKQIVKHEKNQVPFKHILALPTWGQKCIISELYALK